MAENSDKISVAAVLKNCGVCLEAPHWHAPSQTLYFVDQEGGAVHRYRPADGAHEKVNVGDLVGAVVTTASGKLLLACKSRFAYLDWSSGALTTVAMVDEDKPTRFNDGKCDAKGRFWAGTMGLLDPTDNSRPQRQSALYSLQTDESITKHLQDVDMSNGIAWSLDDKIMYYIDTTSRLIDAFDFNLETGEISNRRTVVKVPEDGWPDGMCIDSEGMLWQASFGGARINRFNPNTGEKLQSLLLPAAYITSCCFGGPTLDELYVTSSLLDDNDELASLNEHPLAGSLFKVTGLGIKGLHCAQFSDAENSTEVHSVQ